MIEHLLPLAASLPEAEQAIFNAAASGDSLAISAIMDLVEERGLYVNPFEVGKAYYIETLTLYYIGEVVESHSTWIGLRIASWVHWTGRKSVLFKNKSFAKKHFVDCSTPRTEYLGTIKVSLAGINAWEEWPIENLPKESIG